MREVAVIGVGQSKFGKLPQKTAVELGVESVVMALDDAGMSPKDIQVAYASRLVEPFVIGQHILKEVGIRNIEMVNVVNDCAGGSTAFRGVWKEIANGNYDIGIAVGVESMTTMPDYGRLLPPARGDLTGHLGMTMVAGWAITARRMIDLYGATPEDFAHVSVKNHHNACLNPFAQYQKEFTIEDVLNSRMICEPITLFECCPMTDGGAAAVLCSADMARRYTTKPIKVIGSALLSGDYDYLQPDIVSIPLDVTTVKMAYEMAGVGPEDLDVLDLHDAFAPEEILHYEALGLCKEGEGVAFLRSGATELGGKIPVNPGGGLLALGHPMSASGVRNIVEVVLQLRGQAGARQIPDAKIGMTHMLGGWVTRLVGGACAIHILAR